MLENVEVYGAAPCEQVLEEAQQLVAGRPRGHLGGPRWTPSVRFCTTLSMWCRSCIEMCSKEGNCRRLCFTNGMLYWYMRKRTSLLFRVAARDV